MVRGDLCHELAGTRLAYPQRCPIDQKATRLLPICFRLGFVVVSRLGASMIWGRVVTDDIDGPRSGAVVVVVS